MIGEVYRHSPGVFPPILINAYNYNTLFVDDKASGALLVMLLQVHCNRYRGSGNREAVRRKLQGINKKKS